MLKLTDRYLWDANAALCLYSYLRKITLERILKPIEKIIVAVDDMFFAAKILSTAQSLGKPVERVKSAAEIEAAISPDLPTLVIIDLNSGKFDALEIIAALKAQPAITILGFLSHVQIDLRRRAEQAGCDYILPRSAFSQLLPEILSGKMPKAVPKAE